MDLAPVALRVGPVLLPDRRNGQHAAVLVGAGIGLVDRRQMMDLLTRIEASLEFMNDGGRVDAVNLRVVLAIYWDQSREDAPSTSRHFRGYSQRRAPGTA